MDNLKGRVKCLGPSFVISAGSLHSTFNLSYLIIPVEESDKFHKGCKQSGKSPRIWAPTCPGEEGGTPIHYQNYITFQMAGKQPFESIQGQIAFKNTVQCINKQTIVLLLHPRTEYKKLAHF